MRNDFMVVIPARYDSTRLPGKPLIDLCGKPMIVRSWERVCLDVPADRVIVATDTEQIMDVCREHGIERVEMTSKDCRTGTDRAAEVAQRHPESDLWVVAMGDNPFLSQGVIEPIVEAIGSGAVKDAAWEFPQEATIGRAQVAAVDIQDETVQKMVVDFRGYEMFASRRPIPYSPNDKGVYWKQVNVYAMWTTTLKTFAGLPIGINEAREGLEILRLIEHHIKVKTVEVHDEGFSVDVPADVERARRVLGCLPPRECLDETLPDYLL